MICLLDTCAIIHLLDGTLSPAAMNILGNSEATYVSVVSLQEIAIKTSLGKLQLEIPIADIPAYLAQGRIDIVEMSPEDALSVAALPFPELENGRKHTDPFDRFLVLLARTNQWELISSDRRFLLYGLSPVW